MQNDEIVHVLYVARGRLALSEHKELRAALTELQHLVAQQDLPLLFWSFATNLKAAVVIARKQAPGIAIVETPERRGRYEFCTQIRTRWPSARIIAITNDPLEDAPLQFDRCISLPMMVPALQTALGELLHTTNHDYLIEVGDISLDLQNRTVLTPKGMHHMTPKQCALLQMFMNRRNEVVSRREIMQEIWQTNFLGDTRTLDVHIRWLRERIEIDPSNPRYLVTVRGRGYRFRG